MKTPGSWWWVLLPIFFGACSGLPEIVPAGVSTAPGLEQACSEPFSKEPRQYLHALEATVAGQSRAGILGLVRVRPEPRELRCVIMTLEGLVVFEARLMGTKNAGDGAVIDRALPPFDAPGMARGILSDIEMIFLPPKGRLVETGRLASGEKVCRYREANGRVKDVALFPDGRWALSRYDAAGKLLRHVQIPAGADFQGAPSRLALTASGFPGYQLTMELVEARPMEAGEKP